MSASLVGSEMCIRDRPRPTASSRYALKTSTYLPPNRTWIRSRARAAASGEGKRRWASWAGCAAEIHPRGGARPT
eukprot:2328288-Alexandrium_andersonii.AAC.1